MRRFQNVTRTKRHFQFGEKYGNLLKHIFPTSSTTAAASCRFTIQGPETVGLEGNWGKWVRMRLQSYGETPKVATWQLTQSGWINSDSQEAAELVLGCFNLTMQDVYNTFGQPDAGIKYDVDLVDIVERLKV